MIETKRLKLRSLVRNRDPLLDDRTNIISYLKTDEGLVNILGIDSDLEDDAEYFLNHYVCKREGTIRRDIDGDVRVIEKHGKLIGLVEIGVDGLPWENCFIWVIESERRLGYATEVLSAFLSYIFEVHNSIRMVRFICKDTNLEAKKLASKMGLDLVEDYREDWTHVWGIENPNEEV